ncbi:MAG: VOC family protein [Patescibacteria group bacterium]
MVKVTGIHHIVLKVSNTEVSKDFYVKALGMKVFSEEEGAYGLNMSGFDSFWLVSPDNNEKAAPFNRHGDIGLDH